jgi:hypothetical protein
MQNVLTVMLGEFFESGQCFRWYQPGCMGAEITIDCGDKTMTLNQNTKSSPIYAWAAASLQMLDLAII